MSKKRTGKRQAPPKRATRMPAKAAVAALVLCLTAGAVGVSRWEPLRRGLGLSPAALLAQATPTPTPLTLAKEYVYAGGRLVATEEPKALKYGTSGCCLGFDGKRTSNCRCKNTNLPKPLGLTATAEASTSVAVGWSGGDPELLYEVERSASVNGPFNPVTLAGSSDNTAGPCTAYIYRARSVDEYGDYSDYSNIDLATTCMFSQDPLSAGSTVVRAMHLEELRLAVAAVRATAAKSPPSWTEASLAGKYVKAAHVLELRSQLDEAMAVLALPSPPPPYTDAALAGVRIKAAHIDELRQRVK